MPHGLNPCGMFLSEWFLDWFLENFFPKKSFADTMYQNKVLSLFFLMKYTSCSISIYLP